MRVTGGRLGGRTLRAPKGHATRPTTDRVRESLFQILGDLSGLRVADLYAGSGALGIEALSRGASFAVFVESRRAAAEALRANLDALKLDQASVVIVGPVERASESLRAHGPFELILADPPWEAMPRAMAALRRVASQHLTPGARLVVEHAARDPLPIPLDFAVDLVDERQWGDTAVSMFSHPTPGKG